MAKNFLWITKTKENLEFYSDSAPKSGLSLHFSSNIDEKTKREICIFVRYLRKEFFFPIRCNIYFCNQEKFRSSKGGYCYGLFYSNERYNRRIYPQIYIPAKMNLYQIFHSLCHELSHYFQWYFLEDEQKTDHSLEIQASKCASTLLDYYCNKYCKKPDDICKMCYNE